ncbi:hypothetical protein B0H12DRAFT_1074553 [Mycena haematopus]|nr:hypothetical protein B0H12DRAFT_1074553 [Mycena haematopus]
MAIDLKTWVPRDTKPTWDWKAKKSAELAHFNVPFAVKEYVQNIVGQILKDLQVREWADWNREDLRQKANEDRDARKRSLVEAYPSLLTGPHGVSLRAQNCLPLYILSANIPIPSKTNLLAAIVLWSTGGPRNALSFFNNHLDDNASFTSFAVDGESTSKHNKWAVGEKGKGFILATQYLAEYIAEYMAKADKRIDHSPPLGISFRVGEQIGELKWKKSHKAASADSLRLILDDLTTRTVEEYLPHRYHQDIDDADDGGQPNLYDNTLKTDKMHNRAVTILKQGAKHRLQYDLDGPDSKSMVKSDEVCITLVGIAFDDTPESLFSAIFGIIPPSFRWRTAGSPDKFLGFTIGINHQHVPFGIRLNRLSVNYHGDLSLSSERVVVLRDHRIFQYRDDLRVALHRAFRTFPDLAIELAHDILKDDHSDAFSGILSPPPDKQCAAEYRTAFEMVWRRQLSTPLKLHPHSSSEENLPLFPQLGLEPVMVKHKVLDILHNSGAYAPVTEYARNCLLTSPPLPDFSGLDRARATLRALLPDLPSGNLSVRKYDNLYPTVVWDAEHNLFALAQPKPCEDHPAEQCLCWIGPVLQDIVKEYKRTEISARKMWRAFAVEMGGDTTIKQVASVTPMDTGGLFQPQFEYLADRPRSASRRFNFESDHVNAIWCSTPPHSTGSPCVFDVLSRRRLAVLPKIFTGQGPVAISDPSPAHVAAVNNMPRAAHTQPTVTQPAALSSLTGASSGPSAPPHNVNEAALNKAALSQLSKALLGFDLVKQHDEIASQLDTQRGTVATREHYIRQLSGFIAENQRQITDLKDNKDLWKYVEEAKEDSDKARKRQRTE